MKPLVPPFYSPSTQRQSVNRRRQPAWPSSLQQRSISNLPASRMRLRAQVQHLIMLCLHGLCGVVAECDLCNARGLREMSYASSTRISIVFILMPVVSQAWPGNEALDRGASPDLASSSSFTGSVRMAAGTIVSADSERHCRASSLPFARLIFQCNGLRPVGRRVRDQFAPTNALRNLDLIVAPSCEYSIFRCVQGRLHAHVESVAVTSAKGMRSHDCYRDLSPLRS